MNSSLTGDLVERYQRGQSRVWYWRQVLFAIIVGFINDIRAHKFAAIQTLFIGLFFALQEVRFLERLPNPATRFVFDRLLRGAFWKHEYAYLPIDAVLTVAPLFLLGATVGWIVGTRSQSYRHAMWPLLLCVWTVLNFQIGLRFVRILSWLPRYRYGVSIGIAACAMSTLGVLVGGLVGNRRNLRRSMEKV
jgi:hypothetical protein